MTTIEVTIGWTRSDLANGYSSFETVTVDTVLPSDRQNDLEWAVLAIAEAAFLATNSHVQGRPGELHTQIHAQLRDRGFNGSQSGHYSLSVGDTVTVNEVTLACASFGWERVAIQPN